MRRPALATAIIGLGSAFIACNPIGGNGVYPRPTAQTCESRKPEPRGCPEREVLLINLEGATRWQIADGLAADRFVAVAYQDCHLVIIPECTWAPGEPAPLGSTSMAHGSEPDTRPTPSAEASPPRSMEFQRTADDLVQDRELPPNALDEWFSQGQDVIDHYGECAALQLTLEHEARATAGRFPRYTDELVGCEAATHYISAYMLGSYRYTLLDPHPAGAGDDVHADEGDGAEDPPVHTEPEVLAEDKGDSTVLGVILTPLPTDAVAVAPAVACRPGEQARAGTCVVAPLPSPDGVSKKAHRTITRARSGKASSTERLELADEYLSMQLPEGALSAVHPLVYGASDADVPDDVRAQALLVQLESLMRLGRSEFFDVIGEIRRRYPGSSVEGRANLSVGRYFCEQGETEAGLQLFEEVELAFPKGDMGRQARAAREQCVVPDPQSKAPQTKAPYPKSR